MTAVVALTACVVTPRELQIDGAALAKEAGRVSERRCPWRLAGVEDRREFGARAGFLGATEVSLEDAPTVLASLMEQAGVARDTDVDRAVSLRLHRLYIQPKLEAMAMTAVIEVLPEGAAPFTTRVHDTALNWWNSDGAIRGGFVDILREAVHQVARGLDQRCQ